MSNKLKTLSESQPETSISESERAYTGEQSQYRVSVPDTPNTDSEADAGLTGKRDTPFNVPLSYSESGTS